jgi:anti-sigma-K factor RskA
MNEQEFAELAAGHALGALSDDDARAFAAALAEHPEWTPLVDQDAATAAALAEAVDDVAPPAHLRAELLARIAAPAPPAPDAAETLFADVAAPPPAGEAPESAPPKRGWPARAWFALAASIALIAAIGIGATVIVQQSLRTPAVVALDQIEAAPDAQKASATVAEGGSATLHWSESLGKAVLVTEGLPDIGSDESFEMWFVRGDAATPAGVFAGGDSTTALLSPGMKPGDVIAVTVEPAGGSPDGQPSSDPILAVATS